MGPQPRQVLKTSLRIRCILLLLDKVVDQHQLDKVD